MKTKKRTEVQIETHTYTVIRMANGAMPVFCGECRRRVEAFRPEQIAVLLEISVSDVCRRVEAGEIHLTQNGRSAAFICGNSANRVSQALQTKTIRSNES